MNIALLTLTFLRALGLVITFPLGDGVVRTLAKVGFAGLLAIMFLPTSYAASASTLSVNASSVISELLFGLLMGLPVSLLIAGASSFGELFDSGRGQSIAQIFDPTQQQQVSNMGQFWHQAAIVSCFMFGVPQILLQAFARSLKEQPVLDLNHVLSPFVAKSLLLVISQCWGKMALVTFPLLSVFILVELCFAAISKVAPQLSLSSENFQIKTFLAFVLCALAGVEQILSYWWQNIPVVALGG